MHMVSRCHGVYSRSLMTSKFMKYKSLSLVHHSLHIVVTKSFIMCPSVYNGTNPSLSLTRAFDRIAILHTNAFSSKPGT